MSSIRDVAQRAGVSITTVSKIINQADSAISISPETKERVLAAVREMNFVPSPTARALRRGGSLVPAVAVMVTLPPPLAGGHPLLQRFLLAAEAAAAAAGANLLLCTADEGESPQQRLAGTSAVILFGPLDAALADALAGRPLVGVECMQVAPGLSSVDPDSREGMRIAVQHLAALGHRRIAVLSGGTDGSATPALEREAAFRGALPRYGLHFDPDLLLRIGPPESPEAVRWALRPLLSGPNPPTALIALSDHLARGAALAAAELGRPIPSAMSLVGWEVGEAAEWHVPPLSSVEVDAGELGHRAVEEALGRAGDPGRPARQILVPVQFVTRGSTTQFGRLI